MRATHATLSRAVMLADLFQATGVDSKMAHTGNLGDWNTAAQGVRAMGEIFDGNPTSPERLLAVLLLQRREAWAERFRKDYSGENKTVTN